jgi:hypothetical protein
MGKGQMQSQTGNLAASHIQDSVASVLISVTLRFLGKFAFRDRDESQAVVPVRAKKNYF